MKVSIVVSRVSSPLKYTDRSCSSCFSCVLAAAGLRLSVLWYGSKTTDAYCIYPMCLDQPLSGFPVLHYSTVFIERESVCVGIGVCVCGGGGGGGGGVGVGRGGVDHWPHSHVYAVLQPTLLSYEESIKPRLQFCSLLPRAKFMDFITLFTITSVYNLSKLSKVSFQNTCRYQVSILHKSTAGRYRPVSYPDGPITARYRFM